MTAEQPAAAHWPHHDWGELASDPFMALTREDAEIRAILKRLWTRSGGDASFFDELIPLDGPYGRPPKTSDD